MAELWGFQAGEQQAQQYTQNQALFNLSMREGQMKLDSDAVVLQTQKTALSQQELMLKAQLDRRNRQQAAQAAHSASGTAGGAAGGAAPLPGTQPSIDDLAAEALDNAETLADEGQYNASSESLERASTILKNKTEIQKNDADQRIKDLTTVANLHRAAVPKMAAIDAAEAAGTMDAKTAAAARQQLWRDGNMQFMSSVGRPSPLANQPYSRELFDAVGTETQTNLQQAQQDAAKARTNAAEVETRLEPARAAQIAAATREAEARTHNLEKAGANEGVAAGSVKSKVLGALQAANISIPGGFSGAMLGERLQGYMDMTPQLPEEPDDVYARRVAAGAQTGHAQTAESVSAGRRIGTTAGGVAVGTASITEPGGLADQYFDLIQQNDLSSLAPKRLGQEAYRTIVSDPKYGALVTAAQGFASDYSQVLARGGINVDSQKVARSLINATSIPKARAVMEQAVREMQAVESGAAFARGNLGDLQNLAKKQPGLSSPPPPAAGSWGKAQVVSQ